MFYIDEISIFHNSIKKALWSFLPEPYSLSWSTTHLTCCFSSRNITKNVETHSPSMSDVIIEEPRIPDLSKQIQVYLEP